MRVSRDQWIGVSAAILMLATVIAGVLLGGGPETARREQRDQRRVEALSMTQSAIEYSYQTSRSVPTSTETLERARTSFTHEQIPTELWPRYTFSSTTAYSLCTVFETSSTNGGTISRPYKETWPPDFWNHGQGETCYSLTIPLYLREETEKLLPQTSSTKP